MGSNSPEFHQGPIWSDSDGPKVINLKANHDEIFESSQRVTSLRHNASEALALSEPLHDHQVT